MPATSWPTVTSWPSGNSWPGAVFPATVIPSVWFDGNRQAYSDSAGTVPVSSGLIRRINEPPAQGGNWTTPTDAERPTRDSNSVRFEPLGAAGGYEMTRAAVGGVSQNACTLTLSAMLRDNAFAGPTMGMIRSDDLTVGVWTAGALIFVYYAGTQWNPTTLALVPGVQNTIYVEYTGAGITVTLDVNGITKIESFVVGLSSAAVAGAFRIGVTGTGYTYSSISQCLLIPRLLTAAEKLSTLTWVKAQTLPTAYPTSSNLIAYVGDSITRGTAATYAFTYPFLGLSNIRSTKPLTENCDCAIGGTGVTNILRPGSTFYTANSFYNASRIKNVMVFLLGTNDLANGNSVAYTLNGVGAPDGAGLYAACDAARAEGWKVVLLTVGPRSDVMSVSQVVYNATRLAMNTDIAANWALHADAFVDTRGITNFGADGDSDNASFYSADKVHPLNAGHALLEPAVRAAVLSLL